MTSEAHAGAGLRAEIQYRQVDGNSTLVIRLTALAEEDVAPVEVTKIDDKTVEITVSGDSEVDEFTTVLKLLLDRLSRRQMPFVDYSVSVESSHGKM